ncbi:MAG: alanine racemase [Synergistaceae bacterium]|jgi:predicted amino acid racemase|nr:alanine racemase [Synergistaceae bacterium]
MDRQSLEINTRLIRRYASTVRALCAGCWIEPTAVVKGYNALEPVTDALYDAGYRSFASSRVTHLKKVKARYGHAETMALRVPMPSEVESIIEAADISLNSELEVIGLLDRAAREAGKVHKVILMRDLGDLREGIFDRDRFVETARIVETGYSNIRLHGIGANLSCYGTVVPTAENLSELAANAAEIEAVIGRRLDAVSGGSSTSLYLALAGEMPRGINHLRVGGANLMRSEARDIPDDALPELTDEAFVLHAEVIEAGLKPTRPIGRLGTDCFLRAKEFEDRGVRKRVLLGVGAFDVGDHAALAPLDSGVKLLGCSSDHLIADVQDSANEYRLGDTIPMELRYQAMLYSTAGDQIERRYVQ